MPDRLKFDGKLAPEKHNAPGLRARGRDQICRSTNGLGSAALYFGPVLRHPAELMLPAVDLGGRVWLGGKPCKGGPAAPAFGG
jgi:hypothetical protein